MVGNKRNNRVNNRNDGNGVSNTIRKPCINSGAKTLLKTKDVLIEDTKTIKFNPIKKKYNYSGLKQFVKEKLNPDKLMLIQMELNNGFFTQFLVKLEDDYFIYKKCKYILDDDYKYYDLSASYWCMYYHQSYSLPIKRDISITEIRKGIKGIEIEMATNPKTLADFQTSDVIQKIMKGEELDKVFRFLKLIGIISAVASVILLVLFIQQSGMLKGII